MNDANPMVAARAVWLLAQLGEEGTQSVRVWLESENATQRLVALRALRAAHSDVLDLLSTMAHDESPAVRREVAVAMRDVPFAQSKNMLIELAKRYDGKDRSYLEAFGIGCSGKEAEVWAALKKIMNGDALEW